jgi:hypothetical protein
VAAAWAVVASVWALVVAAWVLVALDKAMAWAWVAINKATVLMVVTGKTTVTKVMAMMPTWIWIVMVTLISKI